MADIVRWCEEDLVGEEVSPLALNLLVGDGQPDAFRRTYLGERDWERFPAIIANTQPLMKTKKKKIVKNDPRKPLLIRRVWASGIEKDPPTGRMWQLAELESPTSHNGACIPVTHDDCGVGHNDD